MEVQRAARQTTVLTDRPVGRLPIGWSVADPTLEEIVVAYLRRAGGAADGKADGIGSAGGNPPGGGAR